MGVTLTLAITRSEDPGTARAKLEALRAALSDHLKVDVAAEHHLRYGTLVEAMEQGSISMAWMPPLLAIDLETRGIARPLALPVRQGGTSFRAAFFVPLGRKRPLAELSGARVAWVDRASAAGYVVPRMMVESAGYDPATFFASETFYESHDRVVAAVLGELADVGATFCRVDDASNVVWAGWTASDGVGGARLEATAISESIPNDAFVVSASVDAEQQAAILDALIGDGEVSRAARKVFGAERFVAAEPAHYEALRALSTRSPIRR